MKEELKKELRAIAASRVAPEGFVSLGYPLRGGEGQWLSKKFNIPPREIYSKSESSGKMINNWDGASINKEYYITKEYYNKIMKETLEEQISRAKTLIGKYMVGENAADPPVQIAGFVVCTSVEQVICVNREPFNNDSVDQAVLDQQGAQVILHSEITEDGCIYTETLENFKEVKPWPNFKINGYKPENEGDFWVFGCAEISKELIKGIVDLNEKSLGNRGIDSVRIGAGTFTIVQLKELAKFS